MLDELELVGYSADLQHLVLRDAVGGRCLLPADHELYELLRELSALQEPPALAVDNGQPAAVAAGNGEPRAVADGNGQTSATEDVSSAAGQRRASRLSPRQIQAALRAGKPPRIVAREAGTDEEWVSRWLPPIEAEREKVLKAVLACRISRLRLGPSSELFGEAVRRNLAARGLRPEDRAVRWSAAKQGGDDRWTIELRYRSRGRPQRAVWRFNLETSELYPRDELATEVAWTRGRGSGAAPTPRPRTAAATDAARTTPAQPVSRRETAMSNGAKKAAGGRSTRRSAAKKSTAKKSTAKKSATKSPTRRATAKRSTAKKSTGKRAPARKAATGKKSTPRKAAAKRTAAKRTTAKRTTAKRTAAKRTAAKKSTAKKSTAKKSTPRKAATKRTAAKKSTARKTTAKRTTARKTTPPR